MKLGLLGTSAFRSYKKPQTLDFSAFAPGFYAVRGRNGAGKSTLFDMVHWTYFNQTSRGLKAGSIKSWDSDAMCSTFLDVDGVRIERGWSPNYLRVDGVDTSQESLEKALRITPNIALHTFHFSQFEDFFVDLRPQARMEIYSDVLGLDFWEQKADDVSKMTKEAVKERNQLEVEKARLEERAETLSTIDLSKSIEDWERTNKEALEAVKQDRDTQRARLEKLKEEKAAKGKEQQRLQEQYNEALKLASAARRVVVQAEDEYQAKRVEEAAQVAGINSVRSHLDSFKKVCAGTQPSCPTCNQPISKQHKQKHISKLERDLEVREDLLKKVQVLVKKAKTAKGKAEEAKDDATTALAKKDSALQTIDARVDDLLKEIKVTEQNLEKAEDQIRKIKKASNPFIEQKQDNEKKARQALRLAKDKQAEIDDAHNFEAALTFWQKGFKDIRYQVMQESLVQLNAEVNESLHDLGLEGWQMKFEVEQETKRGTVKRGFLCTVVAPGAPEEGVPWESWSGGESQRLRVASELGISNMICSYLGLDFNVEFWDEPSTWLEEQGIKDLLAVLQERAQRYQRAIFLADHRALDFPFDGVVTVTKTDEEGSVWEVET